VIVDDESAGREMAGATVISGGRDGLLVQCAEASTWAGMKGTTLTADSKKLLELAK
jgi:hypothetical protein